MAQKNALLLTSIGNKVPLLLAVRSALTKMNLDWRLFGSDADLHAPAQYRVDHFWRTPSIDQWKIEDCIQLCLHYGIRNIIPTRNGDLAYFARHMPHFLENGIAVLVSPLKPIEICLDKLKFYKYLKEKKYPVIHSFETIVELPEGSNVVVKERFGAGSKNLGLGLTRAEATTFALQLQEPLFQPFIQGKEWSVDLYRTRSGIVQGVVARMRDRVQQGESVITTTVKKPGLEELCAGMANDLELYGHVLFQVIEDKQGGLHVVECNPRFGGASTASLAAGLESFVWFLSESMPGDRVLEPFQRISGEIRQIRSPSDFVIPWPH